MACTKPRPAWKATLPNEGTLKHNISFQFRDMPPDYWISCGACDGCTAKKRIDWAIRMHHEGMTHKRNCFVTLTYAPENCPEQINRYDPQTFLKRLRHHSRTPLRYFLTGEYGEKTKRPHYHAIIFGEDYLGGSYTINDQLYGNKYLEKIWRNGDVALGEFSMASAMYTAGYTAKKVNDPDTFSIMSRRPPLGAEWVKKNYASLINMGKVVISGQEYAIPDAYWRMLDGDSTMQQLKEELQADIGDRLTDKQLNSKEIHYKSYQKGRNANEKH